ncbi:acyltransferase family protein [Mucilaginibacter sp. OK098]|uniref:acyltransferase family protein n=1 Tax=Mucilaginibacter sp. OK098 TaxID=1855297 RepID=UPI00091452C7|nr:acyltransferase [Mucilaginibacter sp. OK098]SHM51719.1 Peptidoglycan/LPS O-acetylase OafA/YrhL, contains acyltransferase and SGNH-hydrolase domains [Mucilaginibacter sp. OK098]
MHTSLKQNFDIFKQKLDADIKEIPQVFQAKYLSGLDGLRAISITFVVLAHSLLGKAWDNYFPGSIGVDIFFVISGFLITTLLLKEKIRNGKVSLKKFYVRRILRIFPVAYLYLFCLLILTYIFHLDTTLRMFLIAGLYLRNFPIQQGGNWQTAHFWSLAVEEQFYLLFPFILVRSIKKYLFLVLPILITLPFIIIVGQLSFHAFNYQIIGKFILSFTYLLGWGTSSILIGSVTSILIFKRIINVDDRQPYFLSLIVFVVAICFHITGVLNWNALIYIFPTLISYVIVLNLKGANFFSLILNHPILIKVGKLSYSIYIWQQLFTLSQPWKGYFKYSDSLLLNGIALLAVSYTSYTFFESKFLNLKGKFRTI